MALNVTEVISAVHDHLVASMAQPVYRQGVPDADTVLRDPSGAVRYYVAVQYGTPWSRAAGKTFSGVRHDDYSLPIHVQVIGADAEIVERIAMEGVFDALLGFSAKWTAQMSQSTGGAIYPMTQSNQATEAYVFPMTFSLVFQMASS